MSQMNKTLKILGGGGHAKVVIEIVRAMRCFAQIDVYDDTQSPKPVLGLAIQGTCHQAIDANSENTEYIVAIGHNAARMQLLMQLQAADCRLSTLIHPSAVVSESASVGDGTVVMANAVINAQALIKQGCIVNTSSSVDHDCVIQSGVHIAPGANLCGAVKVGKQTLIGVGSAILPGINIGEFCAIGGGSTVCADIPDHTTAYGTPAKNYKNSGEKSC